MASKLKQKVRERYGNECAFCGLSNSDVVDGRGTGLHLHHIVPKSIGGRDIETNCILLCHHCHQLMEETQTKAFKRYKELIDDGCDVENACHYASIKPHQTHIKWRPIRIDKEVWKDAQDDPRTYTEIMEAGLEDSENTDNVSPMREELRKDRQEQLENVVHACTADAATTEDIADLMDVIRELESAVKEATEASQSVERKIEELQ